VSPRRTLAALVAAAAVLAGGLAAAPDAPAAPIYWGAFIEGSTYGLEDAPFDARTIDTFESHAGKRVSIVHWGQPWFWSSRGGYQAFRRDMVERVRQRGSIPMITWTSEDLDAGGSLDQPDFQLIDIIGGRHDAYIRSWARDARAWGRPMLVRLNHEMNGTWFHWSERANGNGPGQFARMWRHVVDIFQEEGATNVTWVWAPNRLYAGAIPLASLYPGDGHVDWTGVSGYNWGTNPAEPNTTWQSFDAVHRETYDALLALAPAKPIMITETASSEHGGSKAGWIADALQSRIPTSYPRVQALLWFNWNAPASLGNMDWVIESSPAAQAAFAAGIANPHYAANGFGALAPMSKVLPLDSAPAPAGVAGQPAGPGAAAGAGRLRGRILRVAMSRRCGPRRAWCLRVAWRAGPRALGRVRFGLQVRELASGRIVARTSGRARAGARRTTVLSPGRPPRCGRVRARLVVRAAGLRHASARTATVRRSCRRPPRLQGRLTARAGRQ
jgi:hypothetical protein